MLRTALPVYSPPRAAFDRPLWRIPQNWFILALLLFFAMKGALPHVTDNSHKGIYILTADRTGDRLEMIFLWTCGCFLMARRMDRLVTYLLENWLLLALPLWALASALWSQDPKSSVLKGTMYLLDTLFAFYLVDKFEPKRLLRFMQFTCLSAIFLSIAFVMALPQYSFGYGNEWRGIFAHKNDLGVFMVLLMSASFFIRAETANQKLVQRATIGLGFLLIGLSQSRSAWLICFCYMAYVVLTRLSKRFRTVDLAVLLAVIFATCTAAILFVLANLQAFTGLLDKDVTLSGRTQIWAAVLESVAKRPWLGYGYDAFWSGIEGESGLIISRIGFSIGHSHNGYLEVALQIGLVGLGLFAATMLVAFKDAARTIQSDRKPYIQWCVGILLMTIICNIDESYLLAVNEIPTFLYILACAGLAKEAKSVIRERNYLSNRLC